MQEPERYLPERFIEGTPECAAKPAHGYLPFGDGVRACIGLRFAIMEVSPTPQGTTGHLLQKKNLMHPCQRVVSARMQFQNTIMPATSYSMATSTSICLQAKITLIRLYQRFTFELTEGQDILELRETITISAANGVNVRAIPRAPTNNLF